MKLSISIVIPTYNGIKLLKKYLPKVVEFAHQAPIIVVDDASTDVTRKWLNKNYPQVQLIALKKNQGFAQAVNAGFKAAKSDLVLLLNNDVALEANTILNLATHFIDDPNLFAVGALEKLPNGKKRGRSSGYFSRGLLIHQAADTSNLSPTLWVFGASGMFDRAKWQKLSGLDPLYKPAYWEDIDIGYRAWKAGFTCLFDPQAQLFHQGEATMNPNLKWKKQIAAFKNQLLFFWKNISDSTLIGQHFLWLPYHLTVTTFKSKGAFLCGFIWALLQMPLVNDQQKNYTDSRDDEEIIRLVA